LPDRIVESAQRDADPVVVRDAWQGAY
jgi:hypothetical protein